MKRVRANLFIFRLNLRQFLSMLAIFCALPAMGYVQEIERGKLPWLMPMPKLKPYGPVSCELITKSFLKSVDLKDWLPAPRNQTDIGWCYAYAGADAITYELRRSGMMNFNESVSSAYTAFLFNRSEPAVMASASPNASCPARQPPINKFETERESGFADRAMAYLTDSGPVCRESEIRSEVQNRPLKSLLTQFLTLFRSKNRSFEQHQSMLQIAHSIFPTLSIELLDQILSQDLSDPLMELSRIACDTPSQIKVPKLRERLRYILQKSEMANAINYLLNHEQPVILTAQASLYDPKFNCSTHAALITGKKFNCETGKLEFYVRSSWGINACLTRLVAIADRAGEKMKDCLSTCKSENCDAICGAKVTAKMANPPYRCEHGDFVFSAEDIVEHANSITYFEPIKK
jgi:hypothetical protein